MKNKTWLKIGELILDYSKILFGVGIVGPFINNLSLDSITIYAIIIAVIVMTTTGVVTYNKGVRDE